MLTLYRIFCDLDHPLPYPPHSPRTDVDEEFEESYAEEFSHEPILEPKDTYGLRPLPFRIGSRPFLDEENIGLEDLPSDSEDELGVGGLIESDMEEVRG